MHCPPLLHLLLLLAAAGCADRERPASEHAANVALHDSLLSALPDSNAYPRTLLDSLFLLYPDTLLARFAPDTTGAGRWADSVYRALTPDQRIGQLFIVNLPPGARNAQTAALVETHGVGGFLVSRLMPPEDVFTTTTRLQKEARVPLFIAADYERGAGRFNNPLTEIPSNMALGATRLPELAAAAGRLTAIESRATGVNFVFAPVADVNNNPRNPIINIRSYGERGALVGEMAGAFVREAQRYGLLTTLKHFPGHGNTRDDTHSRLATVPGSRAALDSVELRPFKMVLQGPTPPVAVMTAHVWAPGLETEQLPSTFSQRVLTGLLRDTLGFDGLVVTDDVQMGALQNTYTLAQRVTEPFRAGADIILTPGNLPAAIGAVRAALADGSLPAARFEQAVRRVLRAKAQAGLHRRAAPDPALYQFVMQEPWGAPIAQRIADASATLVKNSTALPLTGKRLLMLHLSNYRDSESIDAAMQFFDQRLAAGDSSITSFRYDRRPPASAVAELRAAARDAEVIVVALYLRLISGRGSAGLVAGQQALVDALARSGKPVVLVTFGNPYALLDTPGASATLVLYDPTLASVQAAAAILRGEQRPAGRLPITVGGYAYGTGHAALALE